MGSSEVVDSSGKRNGGSGDLGLVLTQNLEHKETVVPTGTMNLLPMIEKLGLNQAPPNPDSDPKKRNPPLNIFHNLVGGGGRQKTMKKSDFSCGTKLVAESALLTIFYADQVMVFNNFPADKAHEIMTLASKSSAAAAQNHHFSASVPPITPQSPTESTTSFQNVVPSLERAHRTPQFASDLPIARKNSLARFLEKRRDRTTATEPYPARKPAAPSKAAQNNEAWLSWVPSFHLKLGAIN